MPCFHPIDAYKTIKRNQVTGKSFITFSPPNTAYDKVRLPCGRCIGCRIDKSREWALRCVHEAEFHSENCFVTLTINEEKMPENQGLVKSDYVKFMKRLRKWYRTHEYDYQRKEYVKCEDNGKKIRYFHCGEYGEELDRPHHHACLFGIDFEDKVLWSIKNGNKLFTSAILEQIWGLGYCITSDLTWQSAAYVARYIQKKINGKEAIARYTRSIDKESGELDLIEQEYATMSRRPGIGVDWYRKFRGDCFPKGFVTHKGVKHKVPRYYEKMLEIENEDMIRLIRRERSMNVKKKEQDNTLERLSVKENVAKRRYKKLRRM